MAPGLVHVSAPVAAANTMPSRRARASAARRSAPPAFKSCRAGEWWCIGEVCDRSFATVSMAAHASHKCQTPDALGTQCRDLHKPCRMCGCLTVASPTTLQHIGHVEGHAMMAGPRSGQALINCCVTGRVKARDPPLALYVKPAVKASPAPVVSTTSMLKMGTKPLASPLIDLTGDNRPRHQAAP